MHRLFMSYADFTEKTAAIFISHNKFLKMVDDADIKLHQNDLSIMISTTLQTKTSLIKAITFNQFLELLNSLSELVSPKLFSTNPKKALQKLLTKHLIVLLQRLESSDGARLFGAAGIYSAALH